MPPKRPVSLGDGDGDGDNVSKKQDNGESPPPPPVPISSSPSVSPASSVSSSSSVTRAFNGASFQDRGPRDLSPDTFEDLRRRGIHADTRRHPNNAERTGHRAWQGDQVPAVPAAAAQMRLVPVGRGLTPEELDRNQKRIDSINKARIERDSQIDWLQSGVSGGTPSLRWWGQNPNEVVLALSPSAYTLPHRTPVLCWLSVEEIEDEIGNLHTSSSGNPRPPRQDFQTRSLAYDSDDDLGGGGAAAYVDSDADEPLAPQPIIDLYMRFLRNCGFGEFRDSPNFRLWEYRSDIRRRSHSEVIEKMMDDNVDDKDLPKVLHITFNDIEQFVALNPRDRNLQDFVNTNRHNWLARQDDRDSFRENTMYRSDLRFDVTNPASMAGLNAAFESDANTEGPSGSSIERSDGSMSPRGGKRRKPATKRKARRRSASSKRKPTSAAKRRRTATIKSKRTRRTRVRRATRRN